MPDLNKHVLVEGQRIASFWLFSDADAFAALYSSQRPTTDVRTDGVVNGSRYVTTFRAGKIVTCDLREVA